VFLQNPERLQVRHADALPVQPSGDRAALMAGDDSSPGEDLVDQCPSFGRAGRVGGRRGLGCYDHINNLLGHDQFVNGNHCDHGKHRQAQTDGEAECDTR
jgi:hypothetical protein